MNEPDRIPPSSSEQRVVNAPAALATLRVVFAAFCMATAALTVALFLVEGPTGDEPVGLAVAVVMLVGIVTLVVGRMAGRRLDSSSDGALVASYQTRFFLRLGLADAPALVGFAVAIALGPQWVYFVGLAFTVVGLVRLAPTGRNLERDDRDLMGQGGHRSISRLLNPSPMGSPR